MLKSKISAFVHMQPSHTENDLLLKVLEFLKDLGIKRKYFILFWIMHLRMINCKTS